MTHKTKGIVLRTIKYGETSIITTIFTELFGLQTYIVNGIRTTKLSAAKANLFQPAAILDLVVYHNEQKNMNRIKEFKWGYLYENIFTHVIKNCVALYCTELLHKCLKQPEQNTDLFCFCEDALISLDKAGTTTTANFPLYFTLQLPYFFGFKLIINNTASSSFFIDLQEGIFTHQPPQHPYFIEGELAQHTAEILKVIHPDELEYFKLNHDTRRKLLLHYQTFYALHIQEFGEVKSLSVLQDVL